MSKKSAGMFALLTGLVAGAAAVFLSKKENRDKAQEALETVEKKVKEVSVKANAEIKKTKKAIEKEVSKSPVLKKVGKKKVGKK